MFGNDIVIAGITGRFPESANMEEFWSNLINGIDMVTDIQDRWDADAFSIPLRMGQMKGLDKFDANFMGITGKQAAKMDPRMRIFLELTHEALIDSGINPVTIRGSKTGVFLGASGAEIFDIFKSLSDNPSGYVATGGCLSMMANRISFTYDLKGPSMVIDTACSSSLLALYQALLAIRNGLCHSAIAAGVHICMDPKSTVTFTRLGMTSMEGKCRSFDAAGMGYARSEAAVVLYICKSKLARRSYSTIVHGKTNADGYKSKGVTFPSGIVQEALWREVYGEAGINPKDVDYIETHGTGTKAGDPEEANALTRVFCEGRDFDKPLMIGAVKSNMGHPEPAAGLCQIAKVLLCHHHGEIPANLHYSNPNIDIPALLDGRIKVIDKNTKFEGTLVGVNSSGFGGSNVHILLKLSPRENPISWQPEIPVIIPFSGRTAEVELSLNKLMESKSNHLMSLLHDISRTNIPGHNFRSYGIEYENEIRIKYAEMEIENKRPIWFVISGMGAQYVGMVGDMMNIKIFRESIEKSITTIQNNDYDLKTVLYSEDDCIFDDVTNSFLSITSLQVALIDLLNALEIFPDGIIGHSLGEVASAYADGCLNAAQTVLVSHARGRAVNKTRMNGAMATVGMTWAEAERRCPENIYLACHNAIDNVTFSGPEHLIMKFVKELQEEGVFARKLHSSGHAFHCRYMNPAEPFLREYLSQVLTDRATRTSRWISTSVPEDMKNSDLDKYCSTDYFVNNTLSAVRFYEAMQQLPQNVVVIEIASRNFMQSILKRCLPNTAAYIALMSNKASDNVLYCLESLGHVYLEGGNPKFNVLYDAVKFPVPATTPMISPVIRWDHSETWPVPSKYARPKGGGSKIQININEDTESFYSGHVIDGRTIFPATGYMLLVWTTFAKQMGKKFEQQPIVFEKLRFERNTVLPSEGPIEFVVNIWPENGDFEVYESHSAVLHGRIRKLNKGDEMSLELEQPINVKDEISLETEDVYKELRLRGYEYSGFFRGIYKVGINGNWAEVTWQNNWVAFLDTLLQISIIQQPRGLYMPIRLQKAIIDPQKMMEFVLANNYVPVTSAKYMKTIKAPGIEISGLKVSIAPRRPASTDTKLSMHHFVPYTKDLEPFSLQHCLESLLEIVIDNTPGHSFVFAEAQPYHSDFMFIDLIPLVSLKFVSPNITLITDDTSSEFEKHGAKVVSMKDKAVVTNANLVVTSEESMNLVKELVGQNGFLILRGRGQGLKLTEFKLVSHKLNTYLRLYARRTEMLTIRKAVVQITNTRFDWVEKAKHLLSTDCSKVFLYSSGVQSFGMFGFMQCLLREGYDQIRGYSIENKNFEIDFERPGQELEHQISLDLVFNVFKNGSWGCYCNLAIFPEELGKPCCVLESFVNVLKPGDLSSLQWIESPLAVEQNDKNVCHIHYSALNFRDVMMATGNLSKDALPNELAFDECVIGMEYSGKLNGENVCGREDAKCLATSATIDEYPFMFKVPKSWSTAEAATIPTAYATAYYALVMRGRMREGETVLIHSGSGGVGIAAIGLALSLNCKVITTVSTIEKRKFLKGRFPALEDGSITNSRNAYIFEKHVMEVTNGRGVDIVLNSLAQDKLEASIRCLAKFGRFLEIGKVDLFNNTVLGMDIFLRSVNFEGILLDDVCGAGKSEGKSELVELTRAGIQTGDVTPLPYSLFSNNQVTKAFGYMLRGEHIGKVVVSIRNDFFEHIHAIPRCYFRSHKSYVLIGGLGGMGLEIANWMVSRGARNIIFVSRSGIKTGYQAYRVKAWMDKGVNIIIDDSDVSSQAGAENVLKIAEKQGPVGGIFNLALALRDAMFLNQTAENFEIVGKAKILATVELDKASRIISPELDYFVCFSSIASSRGNAGQTSYGFANAFMERICEKRCNLGFPGLAIQWGAVGEVGVLQNLMGGKDFSVDGVASQKIASCLEMFDIFMRQPHPVVSSFVHVTRIASKNIETETLADLVANVLAIKDSSKINKRSTLVQLGLDSLMTSDIKMLLETKKGISLPATSIGKLTFLQLLQMENNKLNFAKDKTNFESKQRTLPTMPVVHENHDYD